MDCLKSGLLKFGRLHFAAAAIAMMTLTGCWDRLEIEERGTVLGIAIDPLQKPVKHPMTGPFARGTNPTGYQVTAQVAIPGRIPLGPVSGGGSNSQRPVWILSVKGRTISDAMNRLQQNLADKIFIGHLRVIIVNEKIARTTGLLDIQDYFHRNPETRRLVWMAIAKGRASDALKVAPKLERVPTLYLVGIMDHAVSIGKIPDIFLGNFWSILWSNGRDPILPYISVHKDQVSMNGLALFSGSRMVGALRPLEVAAYMELANNKVAGYGMAVPFPGNPEKSIILHATLRKSVIHLKMRRGRPEFEVYSIIELRIEESDPHPVRMDSKLIRRLDAMESDLLKQAQDRLLKKLKRVRADSVGFGEMVRGEAPGFWREIQTRSRWHDVFPGIPIHTHVAVHIVRSGMTPQ